MGLFLSEWHYGLDELNQVFMEHWEPSITLIDNYETDLKYKCVVSFVSTKVLEKLMVQVPMTCREEFVQRYNLAINSVMYVTKSDIFIIQKLKELLDSKSEYATDKFWVENKLNENFMCHLLEFETLMGVTIQDSVLNIIFYGTWKNVYPMLFYIPPKNQWGAEEYKDGWFGYLPGDEDDDNADQWY